MQIKMKRFLITTGDRRTWKTDRPVLFLDQGCLINNSEAIIKGLDYKILEGWEWNEHFTRIDYNNVENLYESLLKELSDQLNDYHHTSHSYRYWRILVGPWLQTFVDITFHRWHTIQRAIREHEISGTYIIKLDPQKIIPKSKETFPDHFLSHEWNHWIFGRILEQWTNVSCSKIETGALNIQNKADEFKKNNLSRVNVKYILRYALSKASAYLAKPTNPFLYHTYLPLKTLARLQISSGHFPALYWESLALPDVYLNTEDRLLLNLKPERFSSFQNCIRALIPEQIPIAYFEGYQELIKLANKAPWPKKPGFIFTSNAHFRDEVFKAWTAEKIETQNTPYIIGQHGGFYGTGQYPSQAEKHEIKTADRYLTWGWADSYKNAYPCVALSFFGAKKLKCKTLGNLLQVCTLEMRYIRDPWTDQFFMGSGYLEDQLRFAKALTPPIASQLIIRLHHAHAIYGRDHFMFFNERLSGIRIDEGKKSLTHLLNDSRLSIGTYNSTSFLQTLFEDYPTILFWDPKYNVLRASAQPYFDRLKEVGIFHETPESAAAKVAEVWDDVPGWWHQSEIQEARLYFCHRFARMPENPLRVLKDALISVR